MYRYLLSPRALSVLLFRVFAFSDSSRSNSCNMQCTKDRKAFNYVLVTYDDETLKIMYLE